MTTLEQLLWQDIQAFPLDQPGHHFTFSQRLARENGWNHDFALRVVEEYKKFIFMCAVSAEGVTPSDQVDQAWHLHLTYTHSYWVDLCKNTLGKEIHHHPTQGGNSERQKFRNYYTRTLEQYENYFGEVPPPDIWPSVKQRFSQLTFKRVATGDTLIISGNTLVALRIGLITLGLLSIALIYAQFGDTAIYTLLGLGGTAFLIYLAMQPNESATQKTNKQGESGAGCGSGCGTDTVSADGGDSGCSGCGGCGGCS